MPYSWPVIDPGTRRIGSPGNERLHEPPCSEPAPLADQDQSLFRNPDNNPSYPVIDVGSSRFIVKSGDSHLIQELRLYCETLRGSPRAEVRFTNRLIHCTEQGRLPPWGWQRQPGRAGQNTLDHREGDDCRRASRTERRDSRGRQWQLNSLLKMNLPGMAGKRQLTISC